MRQLMVVLAPCLASTSSLGDRMMPWYSNSTRLGGALAALQRK